jgi:hypothetical protein
LFHLFVAGIRRSPVKKSFLLQKHFFKLLLARHVNVITRRTLWRSGSIFFVSAGVALRSLQLYSICMKRVVRALLALFI